MASAMQEFLILVRYQCSNPTVSQNWIRAPEEGPVMIGTEEYREDRACGKFI